MPSNVQDGNKLIVGAEILLVEQSVIDQQTTFAGAGSLAQREGDHAIHEVLKNNLF